MNNSTTPPDNAFQIRCPKLGHQVSFVYCRRENAGLPCSRVLDCWYRYFAVEAYLRTELSEEEWRDCFEEPAKQKVLSLLEMIEEAQKRTGKNQPD